MKWILRLVVLIFGLVAVLVAAGVFLLVTFDPNAYRSQIETQITEWTGRPASLSGPVELQLFPELALRIEALRIGNHPDFGEGDFVRVDLAAISVAMLPLLRGSIEVQDIRVQGASASLQRLADGRNNWEDLMRPAQAEARRPLAVATTDLPGINPAAADLEQTRRQGPNLDDLVITGLEIRDLTIDWDDRAAGMQARVRGELFRLTDFRSGVGAPIQLQARLVVQPDDGESETIALQADGRIQVDFRQQRFALSQLTTALRLELSAFPEPLTPNLALDLLLDQNLQQLRVDNLQLEWEDLRLNGGFSIQPIDAAIPGIQGQVRSNRFNPRVLATTLGVELPITADPEALTALEWSLDLTGNIQDLRLEPMQITLDGESFRGSMRLDLSAPRTRVTWDLTGDRLNLDRYLPPQVDQARISETPPVSPPPLIDDAAPSTPTDPADIPIEFPIELMHAFDMDGRLQLGSATLFGLELQSVELTLRAREGEWRIDPLSGTGHGGRIGAVLIANVRQAQPLLAVNANLEGIAIASVLEALLAQDPLLAGTGSVQVNLQTRGQSLRDWTAQLNGDGAINLVDGLVNGINVARIIRQAEARLRGETPEPDAEPNATDFASLNGSFRIANGQVSSNDLTLVSPLLRVAGSGEANLVDQTMNLRIDTTLVATLEGQGGRQLDELRGLRLPIRVTGSFTEPRFGLELEELLKERLQDRARREVEQLQERLLDRIGLDRPARENAGESAAPPTEALDAPRQELERQLQRGLERLFQR
jgi:AsmA protein